MTSTSGAAEGRATAGEFADAILRLQARLDDHKRIEVYGSQFVDDLRLVVGVAPELLEALKGILSDVGEMSRDGYYDGALHHTEVDAARAVLAKVGAK